MRTYVHMYVVTYVATVFLKICLLHKIVHQFYRLVIPYTANLLKGKRLWLVREENGYLWENFCASMLVDLYCHQTRP